jgi:hypothetical protein
MTSKRHAKPTAAQLAERTYRRVLAIEKRLARDNAPITEPSLSSLQAIGWGARKDINDLCHAMHAEFATIRTLTDHCARLLREKETLQRRLYAVQELKDESKLCEVCGATVGGVIFCNEASQTIKCPHGKGRLP